MSSTSPILLNVVGPTAIGKTKLAIDLAKYFETEIISTDSRQFYKELSIGTAVPSKEELSQIPHHFIHNKSIIEDYNVGKYEKEALNKLEKLFTKHKLIISVGGSGLYIDAINKGLHHFPEVKKNIRQSLHNNYEKFGIEYLKQDLKKNDPEYYYKVDLSNPVRILRALEVFWSSGTPYSSYLKKDKQNRPFKSIYIGLNTDREILYNRINHRVDLMMANGLLEEVESVLKYRDHNALQTVGYKEMFLYLDEHFTLDEAINEIKKNSRRYAKRQITWFKRNPEILWFDIHTDFSAIIQKVKSAL